MAEQRKKIMVSFMILALVSLLVRLVVLFQLGPLREPDSAGYIDVSRILAETGQFAVQDQKTRQIVPYAMRVPLFHFVVARLINIFGPKVDWPISLMNVILSTVTVVMASWLFYKLVNLSVGLLTGYLLAFNPNSIYNSLLIMPDILFAFFCLLAFCLGAAALAKHSRQLYFSWGLAIGLAVLVKPVFKYYWLIVFIVLAFQYRDWRSWSRYAVMLILGLSMIIGPWLIRNHRLFGFWRLDLSTGIASIWSTTDLIRISTDRQRQADPGLAKVRDVVATSRETMRLAHPEMFNEKDLFAQFNYAMYAWQEVQTQLGLSEAKTDRMLTKLGLETIWQNPWIVSKRYLLNIINFLNSPASLAELVCRLVPDGKIYRQPLSVAWQDRNITVLVPTIVIRIAYLLGLLLSVGGSLIWWKNTADRKMVLLLVLSVFYFVVFSFTAGYDRYRLPVDPVFIGLASISITAIYLKIKGKNVPDHEKYPARHYQS
ncbi:MAG: glycosyltransferase family 39 protein [bacterium]|nr:glycosyltransferase family 39 protein [bacterium]